MLRKFSIISFFSGFSTFLVYLALFGIGEGISVVFFWAPIVVIIASLLYQIMNYVYVSGISKDEILIVLEIFLFTFVVHLMVARPGSIGLVGHDPHYEYSGAKTIMDSGWPIPTNIPITVKTRNYSEWPMLDFLTIIFSEIIGMDLLTAARLIPILINSFTVVFLYLFARVIYKDRRISFTASLAFAALFPYINFQTHFVRESFAFVLLFACLYCLVKAQRKRQKVFHYLGIFLVVVLIFSHHLTSFVLLLFLFIAAVLIKVVPKVFKIGGSGEKRILLPSFSLLILALLLNVSYWTTVGEFVLRASSLYLSDLSFGRFGSFSSRRFSLSAGSIRAVAASYGNILFLGIFGILILSYLLRNTKKANVADIVFAVFGLLCVISGYVSLYITSFAGFDFTRPANFGYAFLLIPVAHVMTRNKHRKAVAILLGCFILLQVFTIPSYYYDLNARPEYAYGSYREYYLPEEYSAVDRFNLSGKVIGDWTTFELFGGLQQVNVIYQSDKAVQIFEGNLTLLKGYDWFVFRHEDFDVAQVGSSKPVAVTIETYNEFGRTVLMEKVYNNGEVEIYRSLVGMLR